MIDEMPSTEDGQMPENDAEQTYTELPPYEELEAKGLANAQETQARHRRLLAGEGTEEDHRVAERLKQSQYGGFDRAWASDDD